MTDAHIYFTEVNSTTVVARGSIASISEASSGQEEIVIEMSAFDEGSDADLAAGTTYTLHIGPLVPALAFADSSGGVTEPFDPIRLAITSGDFDQVSIQVPNNNVTFRAGDFLSLVNSARNNETYYFIQDTDLTIYSADTANGALASTIRVTSVGGNSAIVSPDIALTTGVAPNITNIPGTANEFVEKLIDLEIATLVGGGVEVITENDVPDEAGIFAAAGETIWLLDSHHYERQPNKRGEVQFITRDDNGHVLSRASQGTASTNLRELSTGGLTGNRDSGQVAVVSTAFADTTIEGGTFNVGTLSVRFNRTESEANTALDANAILSMVSIRNTVLDLLDGISATNPQVFRIEASNADDNEVVYYECTAITNRRDDLGIVGSDAEFVYRGIELQVRSIFNERGKPSTAATDHSGVRVLNLFDLLPTGGEVLGAGLEREANGTVHVNIDNDTLETSGGVLQVSAEGISDPQINTGAVVERTLSDEAVVTRAIRDRSVTGEKIALGGITIDHLDAQTRRDVLLNERAVTSESTTGETASSLNVISPSAFRRRA